MMHSVKDYRDFSTEAEMGVAALRWIITEVSYMSYKQSQCAFSRPQWKSLSSEAFMASPNKGNKIYNVDYGERNQNLQTERVPAFKGIL